MPSLDPSARMYVSLEISIGAGYFLWLPGEPRTQTKRILLRGRCLVQFEALEIHSSRKFLAQRTNIIKDGEIKTLCVCVCVCVYVYVCCHTKVKCKRSYSKGKCSLARVTAKYEPDPGIFADIIQLNSPSLIHVGLTRHRAVPPRWIFTVADTPFSPAYKSTLVAVRDQFRNRF